MKKIFWIIFILCITQLNSFAVEEIQLGKMPKEKVEVQKIPKTVKGSLLISEDQMLQELVDLQKTKDLEDIEKLWKATVSNNKVIEFALKKLATPESQRRIHSSLMAKTLSAIVSGTSFAPSFMTADPMIRTGSFAAGRLAQTLINKKNIPQEVPLTDTELIELAGLVENLQDTIINCYYNYKSSLSQIKETRSKLILYNKNYNKALDGGDLLEITISSAMYDDMVLQEFYYKQNATKYLLELQRLAGKKAVVSLNLYQYNFNAALFKDKTKNPIKNITQPVKQTSKPVEKQPIKPTTIQTGANKQNIKSQPLQTNTKPQVQNNVNEAKKGVKL